MSVSRLVYASTATGPLDSHTVEAILRTTHLRNEQDGITGLLATAHNKFLQILEGPRHALDMTFARIQQDARHHDIDLIQRTDHTERQFPDWVMGCISCETAPAETVMHWYWAHDDNIHALLPAELERSIRDLFVAFCATGRATLSRTG